MTSGSQGVRWATKHSMPMHSQRFIHSQRFTQQLQASDPSAAELAIELTATKDEKFGDYQISSAMAFAKKAGKNPRQVAEGWLAELQPLNAGKLELEIAGPGFINVKLTQDYLYQLLDQFSLKAWDMERPNQTVVVDYSSPNVAKEMHVGHIRSTILGDSIARILEYGGDRVLRQNHLGDWGTQFGMLCALLQESESDQASSGEGVGSLEGFYREANRRFKEDPEFEARARATVVALHEGDSATLELWAKVVAKSREHFQPLYERLKVSLKPEHECGESFYRHRLAGVVSDLREQFAAPKNGMEVRLSDGAVCCYLSGADGSPLFLGQDKEPLPFLIQKSDGAFLYSSTDLAACRYRVGDLKADRIIVVTDARQALHFKMLIETVTRAGWLDRPEHSRVKFEHITFGSILGADRKPLKTRSGDTVKLEELLDEAVERSLQVAAQNRELDEAAAKHASEVIGIGSVKYSDLSQNRSSDYIFSWDKMLSLDGNTAPYLLYAYARTRSILRKSESDLSTLAEAPWQLEEPVERSLAMLLLRFGETLEQVEQEWKINHLAEYLYSIAVATMRFCEKCSVLKASTPELRASRLRLIALTTDVLRKGLELLGISVLEQM